MFEPSRSLSGFYIAGFQHSDGVQVLSKLKAGKKLRLVPETDNPYDHNAIALYYKNTKLGYVPKENNEGFIQYLFYGHRNVFEAVVLSFDSKAAPWKQVYVDIRIRDARQNKSGKKHD